MRPYLEDLLAATKRFEERADLIRNNRSPILEIGVWPSIARTWLSIILDEFRGKHPDIRVHVNIATKDLTELLQQGSLDCAIGPFNIASGDHYVHLKDESIYVAGPETFPREKGEVCGLEELSAYPVFLTAHFPGGSGSQEFQNWYFSLSESQKVYINSSDGLTLLSLVAKGYGVAFLSQIYENDCPVGVKMLPLKTPLITETILAYSPIKPISKPVEYFIEVVQDCVKSQKDATK